MQCRGFVGLLRVCMQASAPSLPWYYSRQPSSGASLNSLPMVGNHSVVAPPPPDQPLPPDRLSPLPPSPLPLFTLLLSCEGNPAASCPSRWVMDRGSYPSPCLPGRHSTLSIGLGHQWVCSSWGCAMAIPAPAGRVPGSYKRALVREHDRINGSLFRRSLRRYLLESSLCIRPCTVLSRGCGKNSLWQDISDE
ncbi:hypothetical protein GQ53DRAFT_139237 [Thozetella sp. PMI_491]|nr:hypothetical protein GQ53DRAFT_139237 [Thozetella sp. PMI_491]